MRQDQAPPSAIKNEILSIGRYSLIYMIGQSLTRAVGFFMIPVYTAFLSPADYGSMEVIEIVTSILLLTISIGASDGMPRYYYNESDTARRNKIVSTIILGFAVIALPFIGLFVFAAEGVCQLLLGNANQALILKVSFITAWFGMFCDIGYSYLRMIYKAKIFVFITTLQLLLALTLNILFVVHLHLNISGIFYSTLITQSVIASFLVIWILRTVGLGFSRSLLIDIFRFGMPLVPSRIGLMLGFVSNRFFLRWLTAGDPGVALAEIGLFSLGHKFGVVVYQFISAPLNSFWAPRRMELMLQGAPDADKTVARVCTYATFSSIFGGLLISAVISAVLDIMADPRYIGAHVVVPFVALSYIALGLETHFLTGILLSRRTKVTSYITVFSLLVVVAWNILLIPRYGLLAAATSNLAGYIPRLALIYHNSQKLKRIPYEVGRLATLLSLAVFLYFISQSLPISSPYQKLFAQLLVAVSFPLLLFLIGFFHKGERQFILQCVSRMISYSRGKIEPARTQ